MVFSQNDIVAESLTSNGYIKYANGLIVQWGNKTGRNNFPIEFPHACLVIVAGNPTRQGDRVDNAFAYAIDRKTYYANTKRSDMNAESGQAIVYYAIGY